MIKSMVVDTVNTEILKVPAGAEYLVSVFFLCNTNTGSLTDKVDVFLVPSGGTVGVGVQILSQLEVTPSDTVTFSAERVALNAGDSIVAKSASKMVTMTVSYVDVSV